MRTETEIPARTGPPAVPAHELRMYRAHTLGVLRRYFRMSIELGRLPSLVGREFFRSRVTSYRMNTFEDAVIFVHDIERCLERLDGEARQLISRIVLQEHTFDEAAALLAWPRRSVARRYFLALDQASAVLLERELLRPFLCHAETCQEAEKPKSAATACGSSK